MDGHKGLRVLAVFFSVLTASASGIQVQATPLEPLEKQHVLLNVIGITERTLFSEWYQGSEIHADFQILRYNNGDGSINKGAKYFSNAEIYSNGSLLISNITKNLEGNYTVFIQGITQPFQEMVFVKVIVEPLPGIIKIYENYHILSNIDVLLNVTKIPESIYYSEWFKGNQVLASNQIVRIYNNGSIIKGSQFFNQVEMQSNGSLLIKNFLENLQGDYTVHIQGDKSAYKDTILLKLPEPLSGIIKIYEIYHILSNIDVLLNVTKIPESIYYSEWFKGNEVLASNQIIRINNDGSIIKGSQFFNQAEIQSNGSLVITNFLEDLQGYYTVHVQGHTSAYKDTILLKFPDSSGSGSKASVSVTISTAIVAGIFWQLLVFYICKD